MWGMRKNNLTFNDYKKLSIYDKFRLTANENPKFSIFLGDLQETGRFLWKKSKEWNTKLKKFIKNLVHTILNWIKASLFCTLDFLIQSPLAIIDLVVNMNDLSFMEIIRLILLAFSMFNTFRIFLFMRNKPCDQNFCPSYNGGYITHVKINKRLFFQMLFTFLITVYFTSESCCMRTFDKYINWIVYFRQANIYFFLALIWYNFCYYIWLKKVTNRINNIDYFKIGFPEFKRILNYHFNDRYNRYIYVQPGKEVFKNLSIELMPYRKKKKIYLITIRTPDAPKNTILNYYRNFEMQNKNWTILDLDKFDLIIRIAKENSKEKDFAGIFFAEEREYSDPRRIGTDLRLSIWNMVIVTIITILTYIDSFLEKKRNNQAEKENKQIEKSEVALNN